MARPLRIEYPGACYHVVNHGNQRNRIFFSPMHYELFLEKLCGVSAQFGVSPRCYSLYTSQSREDGDSQGSFIMNLNVTAPRGQRELARLKVSFAFEKILSRTAIYFKTDTDELLRKSSRC